MFIDKIEEIYSLNDKEVYVKAIAEDAKLRYHQTFSSPAEYAPAYVEAFISSLEMEEFFDEDIEPQDLVNYANQYLIAIDYDLDWRIIENDY